MRVLLVEDDQHKEDPLRKAILQAEPSTCIDVARSVQAAISQIRASTFDIIVLDIALPSHQSQVGGAQPMQQPSGGVEVLLELSYLGRDDKVVVVTQYPDIEYKDEFHSLSKFPRRISRDLTINLSKVIKFQLNGDGWRKSFQREFR